MKDWMKVQLAEAQTWCIEDPVRRNEKIQRELIRYPLMAKQMGLTNLDTSNMVIFDVGGGPVGLSSVLPYKKRLVIDPLAHEYAEYFSSMDHVDWKGEDIGKRLADADLVIVTNAMDHFDNPAKFMQDIVQHMKAGAYFAHFHAINNSITHKHEAHEHSLNPKWMHSFLDSDFETCWELVYPEVRYGWVNYNGKVGQPAFCGLYRKVTGYS